MEIAAPTRPNTMVCNGNGAWLAASLVINVAMQRYALPNAGRWANTATHPQRKVGSSLIANLIVDSKYQERMP
jgi:hypothetical protein